MSERMSDEAFEQEFEEDYLTVHDLVRLKAEARRARESEARLEAHLELFRKAHDSHDGTCFGVQDERDAALQRAEKAEAHLKACLADTAVTCAYCEARQERPVTFDDIRAHMGRCEKHPLAAALEQVRVLTGQVADLQERLDSICEDCAEKCTHGATAKGEK